MRREEELKFNTKNTCDFCAGRIDEREERSVAGKDGTILHTKCLAIISNIPQKLEETNQLLGNIQRWQEIYRDYVFVPAYN